MDPRDFFIRQHLTLQCADGSSIALWNLPPHDSDVMLSHLMACRTKILSLLEEMEALKLHIHQLEQRFSSLMQPSVGAFGSSAMGGPGGGWLQAPPPPQRLAAGGVLGGGDGGLGAKRAREEAAHPFRGGSKGAHEKRAAEGKTIQMPDSPTSLGEFRRMLQAAIFKDLAERKFHLNPGGCIDDAQQSLRVTIPLGFSTFNSVVLPSGSGRGELLQPRDDHKPHSSVYIIRHEPSDGLAFIGVAVSDLVCTIFNRPGNFVKSEPIDRRPCSVKTMHFRYSTSTEKLACILDIEALDTPSPVRHTRRKSEAQGPAEVGEQGDRHEVQRTADGDEDAD